VFRKRLASRGMLLGISLASLVSLRSLAQTHSGFPVDIVAGPGPHPVMADGRLRLLYELHLTNYAPLRIELTGIDVPGDGAGSLASYRGEALDKVVIPVEKLSRAESPSGIGTRVIGEGHTVVIFMDLTLEPGARPPAELHHRFAFSAARENRPTIEATLDGPVVAVVRQPTPLLRAPLRGSYWVALNVLGSEDHRRSMNAVDGKVRIAQRFAIDWMRLGPDGRLFHGDMKSNANFYDYGAEVLAVADGRISDLKDGLTKNVGSTERSSRDITLDNVVGNYVILDLGQGRFALYAHLQPGSLKIKLGDTVKTGQVLALLGNSGNSDAPHLHFQLMDANSPIGAEGIPYEFEGFTQLGSVDDEAAVLDAGQPWRPKTQATPVVHRREFPFDNAVVTFP
jgi:murein DD-endopeptidase